MEAVSAALLERFDRPGPRYTSYPTAVEFSTEYTAARYLETLAAAATRPTEPLSLYVHLPFCRSRCAFCACNVIITRHTDVIEAYVGDLEREIALVAPALGDRRRVVQLHWGGGTPTALTVPEMDRLYRALRGQFDFAKDMEFAVEVDPRVTTEEQARFLVEHGLNRVSLGVQDVDATVQEAVKRNQSAEQTRAAFAMWRGLGVESINIDLIYGLPRQTIVSFTRTLDAVIELRPDRVACYAFAFVPWIHAHQRGIEWGDLPQRDDKLALFALAYERFTRAGYRQIGMDHFALPADSLAHAAENRVLFRNFMGYTTHPADDSIGFGVSAIGDIDGTFAQNTKKLSRYRAALEAGRPPIERGVVRTRDDRIRNDVIQSLMCNFHLDVRRVEARYGIDFPAYFASSLARLDDEAVANGFVERTPDALTVTPLGRLFIRNVCMAFDAYLEQKAADRPVFSRTI